MTIITKNPYRILGVFANAPQKIRTANTAKILAFLKVNRALTFVSDMDSLLGKCDRSEDLISEAESQLVNDSQKSVYALFWFHSNDVLTDSAEKLFSDAANKQIASQLELDDYSGYINAAVISLFVGEFENAAKYYCAFLASSEYWKSFKESICVSQTLSSKEILCPFLEMLHTTYSDVDWWPLFNQYAKGALLLKNIKKVFESIAIQYIEEKIENFKSCNESSAWKLENIKLLRRQCAKYIRAIEPLEGKQMSASGQIALDKLCSKIISESKAYYRAAKMENEQTVFPVLQLVEDALSIGANSETLEEGTAFAEELKEDIKKLPPKEVSQEDAIIKEEIRKYCLKPDEICWAMDLIRNCVAPLKKIRSVLGSQHSYYRNVSTKIADNALYNCNREVEFRNNELAQTIDKLDALKASLRDAWGLILNIQNLDLTDEFRNGKLSKTKKGIQEEIIQYNINCKDVKVVVSMLSEEEALLQSNDYSVLVEFCKNNPDSPILAQIIQKKWDIESSEFPKILNAKNLFDYKEKYPNSHKDSIVSEKLGELLFGASYGSVDDYRKLLQLYPNHLKKTEAINRIDDILFSECKTALEYNQYIINNPNGRHCDEANDKIEDIAYENAKKTGRYDSYLKRYPRGRYATELKEDEEKSFFTSCCDRKEHKKYLYRYPQGQYSKLAKDFIKERRSRALMTSVSISGVAILIAVFIFILIPNSTTSQTTTVQNPTSQAVTATDSMPVSPSIPQGSTPKGSSASQSTSSQVSTPKNSAPAQPRTSTTSTGDNSSEATQPTGKSTATKSAVSEKELWGTNRLTTGAKPYAKYFGSTKTGDNYMVFKTSGTDDYVIIVKRAYSNQYMNHVYIRGGDRATIYLPDGYYNVYFYSGKGWNPNKVKGNMTGGFVSRESTEKDEDISLYSAWIEYTLYPVTNGNLQLDSAKDSEVFN